jgi:hypothetical protein
VGTVTNDKARVEVNISFTIFCPHFHRRRLNCTLIIPPPNNNNNKRRKYNRELHRAPRARWPSRDRYHHLLVEFRRRIPPRALQQLPGSSLSACSDTRHSVPPTREEEEDASCSNR